MVNVPRASCMWDTYTHTLFFATIHNRNRHHADKCGRLKFQLALLYLYCRIPARGAYAPLWKLLLWFDRVRVRFRHRHGVAFAHRVACALLALAFTSPVDIKGASEHEHGQ
jgi:hypothetical protein